MAQIAYYLIIKPLSLLPFWVLYPISDLFYLLVYYIIRYRRKTVSTNLSKSFPYLDKKERTKIARASYVHFCDLIIESIKAFSMSPEMAIRRAKVINPEVVNKFYEQDRPVIIVLGHYGNWEYMAIAGNMEIEHTVTILYHPLKNKFFNEKIRQSRSQYGSVLISKDAVKSFYKDNSKTKNALVFVADQSPIIKRSKKIYWTTFMHQETPIAYGTEKYAREYDIPVVYLEITKVKRGFYEGRFELISDHSAQTKEFEITEKHVRLLESTIRKDPRYYLWTHNRWKHKRRKD